MKESCKIKLSKREKRVFDYMTEFGSITTIQAFTDLGESRLSGAIFALKEKGVNISSKTKAVTNRYGEKRMIKEYQIG